MHAIDTAGSVDGQFQDGNPATNVRGTRLGAAFLNDVMNNLLHVCSEGGVAPTKGRAEDLADAIAAIVAGVVGDGSGAVPTTRQIIPSGLITGGGTLAADRTIRVSPADATDVIAGTSTTQAITPQALRGALDAGLDTATFAFGPFVIKWGSYLAALSEGTVFCPFDEPFPNGCFKALSNARNDSASQARDVWTQNVGAPSADGFTVRIQWSGGGTSSNSIDGFDYIAIGY